MADVTPNSTDLVPKAVVSVMAAIVLAAVAACSGPTPSPAMPSTSGGVAGGGMAGGGTASADAGTPLVLSAVVAFPRTLQADRLVEVRLEGAQGDEWLVTSAGLESSLFTPLASTSSNVRLFEGYAARVRVPLGEAICPAGTGEATARLTLEHDDGATAAVTVTLPRPVLGEINADECATRAVTDTAMPSLGRVEAAPGTSVQTTLTLTRGSVGEGAAVALTGMRGSVVFDMSPRDGFALPGRLPAGDDELAVPVAITAGRCDPHVFAESKKTFVFAVWISVDGGPERYVEVRPGAQLEAALQAAFDACGEAADAQTPGGA